MGTLLFCIALMMETGLAAYSLGTKHTHPKVRSWARITAFAAFIALTLLSVIDWGFQWFLCAVLLFILACIGMVSLIRPKANPHEFRSFSIVSKTILMLLALTLAFAPVLVFPQYEPPQVTGKYKVATAVYTYTDSSRIETFTDTGENRQVNVEFWYPQQSEGTYPLVVFSHGAYGISSSNTSTFIELASHGYVVASIGHPYHSFYTASENGTTTMVSPEYFREFSNAFKDGINTAEQLYQLIQKWMKLRTDDMNFVIDNMIELSKSDSDPVYQHINTDRIGVFGHSMGSAASVWLGRERADVQAVVNLDGPLFSELNYDKKTDSFVAANQSYTVPLLNIYSDDVWKQLDWSPVYAANKTADQNFAESYTVHFEGARHLSFTDLPLFSPVLANMLQGGRATIDKYYCIETTNQLILHFFDYALKDKGRFTANATY